MLRLNETQVQKSSQTRECASTSRCKPRQCFSAQNFEAAKVARERLYCVLWRYSCTYLENLMTSDGTGITVVNDMIRERIF